jgi:hypothetical protein
VEISKKNSVSDIGTRGLVKPYVIVGVDFCHTMQSQQQDTLSSFYNDNDESIKQPTKVRTLFMVRLQGLDILSHLPHQLTAAWTLL